MRSPEIIVKVLCEGEREADLFRFDSVNEAASYIRDAHKNDAVEYVLEIEHTAFGLCRGFDRKEEFETEWLKIEREAIEDQFHFGLQDPDYSLHELLEMAAGPIFSDQSSPVARKMEAAE